MRDPVREMVISPTIQVLYDRHWGMSITCADCGHIMAYRTVGLLDRFKRYKDLTLLQLEAKCRCQCGSKNIRVYPWEG
jgi:hypothetical protein